MMLKKDKPRPENAPGSNGLRGGKKMYTSRTAVNHWLDEWGGHPHFNRGFTSSSFVTESEHAHMAMLRHTNNLVYGAALHDRPEHKSTTLDNFRPVDSSASTSPSSTLSSWMTNTQLMSNHTWKEKVEEKRLPKIRGGGSSNVIDSYRLRFSDDDVEARNRRFLTETRRACSYVDDKFRLEPIKLLNNAPRSLEELRARLIEKYGILAMSAARFTVLGLGLVSTVEFKSCISKLEVKLSSSDMMQLIAFFTPDDSINTEHFMVNLLGRVDGFDEGPVRMSYSKYFRGNPIPVGSLRSKLRYSCYPEVADGLLRYVDAYASSSDGTIGLADFMALHRDLYASDRMNYGKLIPKFWE